MHIRCEERFTKILYTRFVTFQHTYLALADFLDSGSRYNYQFARFKLVNIRITRTLIFVSSNPSGHSSKRHLFWFIQDYPCMTDFRSQDFRCQLRYTFTFKVKKKKINFEINSCLPLKCISGFLSWLCKLYFFELSIKH